MLGNIIQRILGTGLVIVGAMFLLVSPLAADGGLSAFLFSLAFSVVLIVVGLYLAVGGKKENSGSVQVLGKREKRRYIGGISALVIVFIYIQKGGLYLVDKFFPAANGSTSASDSIFGIIVVGLYIIIGIIMYARYKSEGESALKKICVRMFIVCAIYTTVVGLIVWRLQAVTHG
ncbi:MAG: hypothetical protein JWN50_315 [Parcubacteria group bacterium]|nr:hypothetical protein [Parcubacteria group bacterium]